MLYWVSGNLLGITVTIDQCFTRRMALTGARKRSVRIWGYFRGRIFCEDTLTGNTSARADGQGLEKLEQLINKAHVITSVVQSAAWSNFVH